MKINRQIMLSLCSGIILVGLLSGCAPLQRENMANSATEFNLVVEKIQNEMLLLNVVRASKRRPMYFTAPTALKGSVTYSYETGSINIPYGKFGTNPSAVYSVVPKVIYSNNPVSDVAVLNTKEFTRGLQAPVPFEFLQYYWQQGWRKELLLHLFVRSIEIRGKTYVNSPGDSSSPNDRANFADFQNKLREMLGSEKKNCELKTETSPSPGVPKIQAKSTVLDLKTLIEIEKANLTLSLVGDEYQLQSKKSKSFMQCGSDEVTLTLRSPEAILYYLGEIVRAQAQDAKFKLAIQIEDCEVQESVQLFVARESMDTDKRPYVTVNYEGAEYVIPRINDVYDKCRADRSMQVLELVSLIIAKQTSATELPPPTGVTITTK